MVQAFKAQKRGLKTAVQGLQSFVGVEFGGAELPIAEWWDTVNDSHVASFVGDMVRAALVLMHRREPVCLRFGPLLSSLLFLVAGFPAVGDFGQEFADALDVRVGPDVCCRGACNNRIGGGYLSALDVPSQRRMTQPQFVSCLTRGVLGHFGSIVPDS